MLFTELTAQRSVSLQQNSGRLPISFSVKTSHSSLVTPRQTWLSCFVTSSSTVHQSAMSAPLEKAGSTLTRTPSTSLSRTQRENTAQSWRISSKSPLILKPSYLGRNSMAKRRIDVPSAKLRLEQETGIVLSWDPAESTLTVLTSSVGLILQCLRLRVEISAVRRPSSS